MDMAEATTGITGATRLYAVIGDPVAQVRAPTLVNTYFARAGLDAVLVPVQVAASALAEVLCGLKRIENLDGVLVTVPHKVAARALADRLSPTVAITGSTNALRREPDGSWFAENFDGIGFVEGLRSAGHSPAGARVSLVGAGGAGSAIAVALLTAGAARVAVHDTDHGRLADLVSRLESRWPGRASAVTVPAVGGVDLIVNATPLGLAPDDPLPFAPAELAPECVVADIVMKPADTALLRASAALGHPVLPGAAMLDHQLELYRGFFRLDRATRAGQLA